MDLIPIATLSSDTPPPANASIRAIVTLSWPYSSSTKQCALLLADPDFRLRKKKGQVRVRFSGPGAEAVAKSRIDIGDEVVLQLSGARWAEDGESTRTPGRSVDGELAFRRKLGLRVLRESGAVDISVNAPTPPHSPERSRIEATPLPKGVSDLRSSFAGMSEDTPVYSSPAYVSKLRLSGSSFFGSDRVWFREGGDLAARSGKRQRLSYGGTGQWRYAKTTPTPSPERKRFRSEDEDGELEDIASLSSAEQIVGKLTDGAAPITPVEPTHVEITERGTGRSMDTSVADQPSVRQGFKKPPPPLPRLQVQSTHAPDRPTTPVLQPVSSASLPLPSPFPADKPPQLLQPIAEDSTLPSDLEVEERAVPLQISMREIPDTYADTQAALSSPMRDAEHEAARTSSGSNRENFGCHGWNNLYNDYDNTRIIEAKDVVMTESNFVETTREDVRKPGTTVDDLLSHNQLDEETGAASQTDSFVEESNDDQPEIEDSADVMYEDEVDELYYASDPERRSDEVSEDDYEQELPTHEDVQGSQTAPETLSNEQEADMRDEQDISRRRSYLSSDPVHPPLSDFITTKQDYPFGMDGNSTLREHSTPRPSAVDRNHLALEQSTPRSTPQSERDKRMSATYKSLFGFRSPERDGGSGTPSKSSRATAVKPEALEEAAHTSFATPALAGAPGVDAQIASDAAPVAAEDIRDEAPRAPLDVNDAEIEPTKSNDQPNPHKLEEVDISQRSVGVASATALLHYPPSSTRSTGLEAVHLGSSSDTEDEEDVVTHAPIQISSSPLRNEASLLPDDVASTQEVSGVQSRAVQDGMDFDGMDFDGIGEPSLEVQGLPAKAPSTPDQTTDANIYELQPTPPSQGHGGTIVSRATSQVTGDREDHPVTLEVYQSEHQPITYPSLLEVSDAASATLNELQPTPPSQRMMKEPVDLSADLTRSDSPSPEFSNLDMEGVTTTEPAQDDIVVMDVDDSDTPRPWSSASTISSPVLRESAPEADDLTLIAPEHPLPDPPAEDYDSSLIEPSADPVVPYNNAIQATSASSSFRRLSSTPSSVLMAARTESDVEELDLSQVEPDYWDYASQQPATQPSAIAARKEVVSDSINSRASTLVPESSRPSTRDGPAYAASLNGSPAITEQRFLPSQELGSLGLSQPPKLPAILTQIEEEALSTSPLSSPPLLSDVPTMVQNEQVVEQPVEASSPTSSSILMTSDDMTPYCYCHKPNFGEMIGCDGGECPSQWFHLGCVGLDKVPEGKWFCPTCRVSEMAAEAEQVADVQEIASSPPEDVGIMSRAVTTADDEMMADFVQERHLVDDGHYTADESQQWATQIRHVGDPSIQSEQMEIQEAGEPDTTGVGMAEASILASPEVAERRSKMTFHKPQSEHQAQSRPERILELPAKSGPIERALPQSPPPQVHYPSLPMSPSLSQSQPSQQLPPSAQQSQTMASVLPPTPQLTQVESGSLFVPEDIRLQPEPRRAARRSLTARLSGVPEALSAWFTPRKPSSAVSEHRHADDLASDQSRGLDMRTNGVNAQSSSATPITNGVHPAVKSQAISQPLRQRFHRTLSTGLSTTLSYYTPLSALEHLVNARSQSSETPTIDILALVTTATAKPERAKSGPRDFYTTFRIAQPAPTPNNEPSPDPTSPATLQLSHSSHVQVFRPWKAALPRAEPGDIVLLRAFAVTSRKRAPALLSCHRSAWCVWRFALADESAGGSVAGKPGRGGGREEVKGPPVEVGALERERVATLRAWWEGVASGGLEGGMGE